MKVRLRACAAFVKHGTAPKPVKAKFGGNFMWFITRQKMRKTQTRCRGGFKAAIAPASI
jgi:hypothetical protein